MGFGTVSSLQRVQSVPLEDPEAVELAPGAPGSAAVALGSPTRPRRGPTTPAALQVATVVLVAGIFVFGAVVARVGLDRREATEDVGREAAPLLRDAQDLYVVLADADAAASTAFLRAGPEPTVLRARYRDDIAEAGEHLAGITERADLSPQARAAVAAIARELPVYTGRVEAARTNNRLELAVGGAYLRQASELMRSEILPAALTLYQEATGQLDRGYRAGTADGDVVAITAVAIVITVLLVLIQVFMTSRTRRLLNLGLVTATILVIGLAVYAVAMLHAQRQSLSRSEEQGAVPLVLLSTARILALRSLSDANLHLIERGTEQQYLTDFDEVTASVGGSDDAPGLLDRAADAATDPARVERIAALQGLFDDYLAVHRQVRALEGNGDRAAAVAGAVGDQADAALALDEAIARELAVAATSLESNVSEARSPVRWLPVLVVAVVLAALAAVIVGLQVRIREYR